MTSTNRFDLLRDLAYTKIKDHVDSTNADIGSFMLKLQKVEDGIFEESRDNEIRLTNAPEQYQQLCSDLKKKVEIIVERLFDQDNNQVIYRNLGIIIKEGGDIEAEYSYWLYGSLTNIISYFKEKSKTASDNTSDKNRNTRFPSFTLKNQSCLNDLYDQMVSFRYILPGKTDKKTFAHAFQGRSIDAKILWYGDLQVLRYFIFSLKKEKLITPVGKDHWLILCKCFSKSDGNSFDTEQFRWGHKPEDISNIEKILDTIRSN